MVRKRQFDLRIWGLAVGYFLLYAPYCALTKALASGLLPATKGPVLGFQMLPSAIAGTVVMMAAGTSVLGWWKHAGPLQGSWRHVLPDAGILLAGFGTAIIIATTTMAYTFTGVSILFALLLMRGGVLILAPLVDCLFRRRVRWFSWVALALSLGAVGVALADVDNYRITSTAALILVAYLLGYVLRLPTINRMAKFEDRDLNYRYFVQEQIVAVAFLIVLTIVLALIGGDTGMSGVRDGVTTFFRSPVTLPGFVIGSLYAGLYFFGTLIYLDRRENTFCIPLNRCSSLLAGVAGSYTLALLYGLSLPSLAQLSCAGLIVMALLFLSPLHHHRPFFLASRHSVETTPAHVDIESACRDPKTPMLVNKHR